MDIKHEIKSGVFYTFVFRYANMVVQMLIAAFLARLLTPEEYGIVAVITVFVVFFQLISNFGLGTAIIQKQGLTRENIFSLFIFTLILGIIFSLIFSLLGPLIASFYDNSEYKKIANLLSFSLFFHTANIVPYALLMKEKRFKTVGIIYLVVELVTGTIAILLAYNGYSYYALVYRSVLMALLLFIIDFKIVKIKKFKRVNFSIIKTLFSYSFFQLLYNILDYVSKTLDTLLIGKYLGIKDLGYYDRARRLAQLPVNNLANIITPVLHPVLSNHQTDSTLIFNVFKKTTKFLSVIGIPLSIFLYFSAEEIIRIMYGDQWLASIPAFGLLSLSVWIQMVLASNISIFQVLGKTDYLFVYGSVSFVFLIAAILLGIFVGQSFISVAMLLLVAYGIIFIFVYYLLIVKMFKTNLIEFLPVFVAGFNAGFGVLIVNIIVRMFFDIDNLIISLLVKVAVSGMAFIFILFISKELKEFLAILNPKK